MKTGKKMKRLVAVMVCAMACGAFAVACSWQRPWCAEIDLADITSVPIGMKLMDDGGYAMPTNGNGIVVCDVPPEWSAGGKCGALRVSGVLVASGMRQIAGAMGSHVYATVAEGVLAVTNGIHAAVGAASKKTAMFTPPHKGDDGASTILYSWQRDGREVELVVKCYVNERRQMAVCSWLHVKGDSIWCGLQSTRKETTK